MRGLSYNRAFVIIVSCLLILFIALTYFIKPPVQVSAAGKESADCIKSLKGGDHLWESLSKQFVTTSLFK